MGKESVTRSRLRIFWVSDENEEERYMLEKAEEKAMVQFLSKFDEHPDKI